MVQLVIFDFDGTIAHTHPLIIATIQQTLRELNLPVPSEQIISEGIGMEFRDCYRHYVPGISEAMIDRCAQTHRRVFETTRHTYPPLLYPHVVETLTTLRQQHIFTSIASARTTRELRDLLADMQVDHLFDYIIGSEEVTAVKPDPEAILLTLRHFQLAPTQALMVGDMDVDILMGKNAGTHTCGVTYGYGAPLALQQSHPDTLIPSMNLLTSSTLLSSCLGKSYR
ncbi:MAG: HAD family hydrolase [Paludibacteraceae bacterium]|nr:HAD family hydrolase [Paludibacteraceae bacterium]